MTVYVSKTGEMFPPLSYFPITTLCRLRTKILYWDGTEAKFSLPPLPLQLDFLLLSDKRRQNRKKRELLTMVAFGEKKKRQRSSDSSKLHFPEHIQLVTLGHLTWHAGTIYISLDMWRYQASQEKLNSPNSPSACPLTGSLVRANQLGTGAEKFFLWLEFRITLEDRDTGIASNTHLSTSPLPRPRDTQDSLFCSHCSRMGMNLHHPLSASTCFVTKNMQDNLDFCDQVSVLRCSARVTTEWLNSTWVKCQCCYCPGLAVHSQLFLWFFKPFLNQTSSEILAAYYKATTELLPL